MALVSMRQLRDDAAGTNKEAMLAAKAICELRFEQVGCAGRAGKIAPVALDTMAERYARGEPVPVVH